MTNAQLATQLLIVLLQNAEAISRMLSSAQSEGRDVTPAELDMLSLTEASARQQLQDAIDAKAKEQNKSSDQLLDESKSAALFKPA